MPRSIFFALALATLSVGAQSLYAAEAAGQDTQSTGDRQQQPAPIVHAYGGQNAPASPTQQPAQRMITVTRPIAGVTVRADDGSAIETVSTSAAATELRLTRGIANVSVHHPGKDVRILVDLPGGQTAILKDGLYTFNAATNTLRTLKGEAEAFPGSAIDGIKVKEEHQFVFTANSKAAVAVPPNELMADYLPAQAEGGGGDGYGPDGDGYYGYAPLAYGYPFGFYGYPYGYGYPFGYGLGFGFGYYGGFGGFRGRFR
jgi:hypothetical protein